MHCTFADLGSNKVLLLLLLLLVNLYYTFIFPYLSYCNIVWGRAANIYLSRIFLLQKKFCAVYLTLDTGSILHNCLWKVRL